MFIFIKLSVKQCNFYKITKQQSNVTKKKKKNKGEKIKNKTFNSNELILNCNHYLWFFYMKLYGLPIFETYPI